MKHYIISLAFVIALTTPAFGIAQTEYRYAEVGTTTGFGGTNRATAPATPASTNSVTASARLENPLRGVNSIGDFVYLVINFVYSLSYAVIAFFLILSGFKFVMAQGKPDALDNAKETFKNTIIGAIILIGANVITEVVRTVINQFVRTSI